MHVSVYKNSPYYNEEAVANMQCFVNGIEVTKRCFEASEEDGFAKCYVEDPESSHWVINPNSGEPETETLKGEVKLIMKNGGDDDRVH